MNVQRAQIIVISMLTVQTSRAVSFVCATLDLVEMELIVPVSSFLFCCKFALIQLCSMLVHFYMVEHSTIKFNRYRVSSTGSVLVTDKSALRYDRASERICEYSG